MSRTKVVGCSGAAGVQAAADAGRSWLPPVASWPEPSSYLADGVTQAGRLVAMVASAGCLALPTDRLGGVLVWSLLVAARRARARVTYSGDGWN
jgi:hypothetical protein